MLIMLRWSSKSRCRVQVTSNVRLPRTQIPIPKTRSPVFKPPLRSEPAPCANRAIELSTWCSEKARSASKFFCTMKQGASQVLSAELRGRLAPSCSRCQGKPRDRIRSDREVETHAPQGCPYSPAKQAVAASKTWSPHLFSSHGSLTLR
jgi:hypothetical protein